MSPQRMHVFSVLSAAMALVLDYDKAAHLLGEAPIGPTVDLDPSGAVASTPPAARVEGIVPGSLGEDGSVVLEGWMRAVAESAGSESKWHRAWAEQTNRLDRCFINDALLLPSLSTRQRFNIEKNVLHAGDRFALQGTDASGDDYTKRGREWFGYEMEPNEAGLGREVRVLEGVGAFTSLARASEAYHYAIRARDVWIRGRPEYVQETTGIVVGKPGKG